MVYGADDIDHLVFSKKYSLDVHIDKPREFRFETSITGKGKMNPELFDMINCLKILINYL